MRIVKITSLKYYLMLLMVFLHANYIIDGDVGGLGGGGAVYILSQVAFGMGLPCYFFISAFLYGKNYSTSCIRKKLISRIKTIVIPYILWQVFWVSIYAILIHFNKYSWRIIDETYTPVTLKEWLRFIYLGLRNPPLWFLKTLFGFILITPSILELMHKSKRWALGIVGGTLIINYILIDTFPYISLFYWSPVYCMGLYCSIYHDDLFKKYFFIHKLAYLITLTIFISLLFIIYLKQFTILYKYLKYSFWMLVSFLLIGLADWLPIKEIFPQQYKAEYYIFCLHYPLIHIIGTNLFNIFGTSTIGLLTNYIVTAILTIFICHLIAQLLFNIFPKVNKLLCGLY